jgi:hypothetical protein
MLNKPWWSKYIKVYEGEIEYVDVDEALPKLIAEAERRERERIIKLIEGTKLGTFEDWVPLADRCSDNQDWDAALDSILKSLRGEK